MFRYFNIRNFKISKYRRSKFWPHQWNLSIKIKKLFKFPSILLTENNFLTTFSRGPFFQGPFFRGSFLRVPYLLDKNLIVHRDNRKREKTSASRHEFGHSKMLRKKNLGRARESPSVLRLYMYIHSLYIHTAQPLDFSQDARHLPYDFRSTFAHVTGKRLTATRRRRRKGRRQTKDRKLIAHEWSA